MGFIASGCASLCFTALGFAQGCWVTLFFKSYFGPPEVLCVAIFRSLRPALRCLSSSDCGKSSLSPGPVRSTVTRSNGPIFHCHMSLGLLAYEKKDSTFFSCRSQGQFYCVNKILRNLGAQHAYWKCEKIISG